MTSTLLQDLRYALRTLRARPLYALVTVLVLALAIGANTTVFSVLNGFFLRPLPYPDDDRLVMVYNIYTKIGLEAGTSIPDYVDRREQAQSLEELAIVTFARRTLASDGPPEQVEIARASPSLFAVLGVPPIMGRGFTDDEATPGNARVAVLSHRLWSTRFGAREGVLGSDIRLDGQAFRVVGVMPEGFGFPSLDIDAWTPFAFTPAQAADDQRGMEFSISVGRLRPGATIEGLNAELDEIVRRNVESGRLTPDFIEAAGFTGRAELLRETVVGDLEQILLILQGIVLAVLLIACANVANLQLARMAARRKEMSVRAALGATAPRLARLVLIESLAVSVIGGAVGLALAHGGLELVRALGLDRASQGFEFEMDTRVLAVTAGAALVAALLSAMLPIVTLVREDLIRAVHEAGRLGGGGRAAQGFRSALVVLQIAVGVALLVGAGLLTKSFHHLQQEGPGFDTDNVWTALVSLPRASYGSPESQMQFVERALEQLRVLPGVSAAGFTSVLPFSGQTSGASIVVDGYTPRAGGRPPHASLRSISAGYLPSLGIPVIRGRNFGATESELVAIVDENMAHRYWPDGSALGQRVRQELMDAPERWYTIVGVVPTVKNESLAEEPDSDTIYWHYTQRPAAAGAFTLRTSVSPAQMSLAAAQAIRRIDPEVALFNVMSMDARVLQSLGPQRAPMVLTLAFAAGAFLLAVIGVYGVLSWAVTQRFGEIGVRMALGAESNHIVRMILKQGGRLIVLGLAFGVAGALGLGRVMASQIYDVAAADPTVFTVAVAALAAAALLASWLPARRASRIDPMRALREE